MLHACVQTFDVMGEPGNFWEINKASLATYAELAACSAAHTMLESV